MGVLEEVEPKRVFHYFEEICAIPHGSGNTKKISDYLVAFAKKRNLAYRQDAMGNVIIRKDPSKGYETAPAVILQGHMDMVVVKEEDCNKDLSTEGLDLAVCGDLIQACGTSLGGDDGIAVAFALALLADDEIPHPPLEVVITVDEELGMLGADFMDVSDLTGRMLLNIDSEEEGIFTVSCAGGVTTDGHLPYETEVMEGCAVTLQLSELTGGHSGIEIGKGRANAIKLLGRLLFALLPDGKMRLCTISGGAKDNAIADAARATFIVPAPAVEETRQQMHRLFAELQTEYRVTDPEMDLKITVQEVKQCQVFTRQATERTVLMLTLFPDGVQRMNPELKDHVQTSLNLGILTMSDGEVTLTDCVRSESDEEKDYLVAKLSALMGLLGGTLTRTGNYPGWSYRADSRLRAVMTGVYRDLYQKEPIIEGVHAGLECGIFASRLENLDALSFGPQINQIHTTHETLSISSTQRTWALLLGTLQALK